MGSPDSHNKSDAPAYPPRALESSRRKRTKELLDLTKSHLASIRSEMGKGLNIHPDVVRDIEIAIKNIEDRDCQQLGKLSEKPA